jgi:signal transduction histidine kinase
VVVSIKDHGIGIPEVDQERVFERYFRAGNTSGISGSGVGLSLVRSIVDLHRGDISLESTEGKGSRFTLRLPSSAATQVRTAAGAGPLRRLGQGSTA